MKNGKDQKRIPQPVRKRDRRGRLMSEEEQDQFHLARVLILKGRQSSLTGAEAFLRNRARQVVATTEVKVALAQLATGRVSCILISVDHPSPGVAKLPQLCKTTFKTPMILFAEGAGHNSITALRSWAHPYSLYPPVSGPAIERTLISMEKDLRSAAAASQTEGATGQNSHSGSLSHNQVKADESFGADSFNITKRGENPNEVMNFSGVGQQAGFNTKSMSAADREALAKIFEAEGLSGDEFAAPQEGSTSGGFAQTQFAPAVGPAYMPGQGSSASGPSFARAAGDKGPQMSAGGSGTTSGGPGFGPGGDGATGPMFAAGDFTGDAAGSFSQEDPEGDAGSGNPSFSPFGAPASDFAPGADKSTGGTDSFANQDPSGHPAGPFSGRKKKKTAVFEQASTATPQFTEAEPIAHSTETMQAPKDESILIKGTEHALASASVRGSGQNFRQLEICSNMSCFRVKGSDFAGVMVVAFGEDRVIDDDFMENMRTFMIGYFHEQGQEVSVQDVTTVKLEEVAFESWSMKEAEFLRSTVHNGSHVALAYFPSSVEPAPLELSVEAHMLKMKLSEINTEVPTHFDIYLHFPANKKYIRYTGQNRTLFAEQKARLMSSGVAEIHVRKESGPDVSRFRTHSFLSEKIHHFKQRRKAG